MDRMYFFSISHVLWVIKSAKHRKSLVLALPDQLGQDVGVAALKSVFQVRFKYKSRVLDLCRVEDRGAPKTCDLV
jgi:hypothetical protein